MNQPESLGFKGGQTDVEGAKAVARRMFELYDRDRNGILDSSDSGPMISDAYKSFNRQFKPSRGDSESYLRILDRDKDGVVTYQDIEEICLKYLCPQASKGSAKGSETKTQQK